MTRQFTGPIFILGMVRSGTKLLRDLLNQNPQIGIPISETHFIPDLVAQFGNPPNFGTDQAFAQFYQEFTQTYFWKFMQGRGFQLRWEDLSLLDDRTAWDSIFSFIFRFYAPVGRTEEFIWGDKTPLYLHHVPLLKSIFPDAKFIHIVRDPRDYCLSVKHAWGKSLLRAANAWSQGMMQIQHDRLALGADYMELTYESLLEDPEGRLRAICAFLGCDFVPQMMQLGRATEDLGSTIGATKIVHSNARKYLTQLSAAQIKRIEEIVYQTAQGYGYEFEYAVQYRPLSPAMQKLLTLSDGIVAVRRHTKQDGWRGLQQIYDLHRHGTWFAPHLKPIRSVFKL